MNLKITLVKKKAYDKMIGNITPLTSYTNGKKSYNLNIPLNFWFCNDSGLALPLIAMTHNDIKIHVEFNDFSICYKESPTNYIKVIEPFCLFKENELITQNIDGNTIIGEFVYFDFTNQNLYYNKLVNDFIIPPTNLNQRYKIIGSTTNFEMNIDSSALVITDESYFRLSTPSILDAYLLVDYIYLDNQERFNFIKKQHQYLIPIVQNINKQIYYSSNISYKIPFVNPIKIIFWRAQLLSNIKSNDLFNYSMYPLITTNDNNIIQKQQIILNSIERTTLDKYEHYTNLQIYLNNLSSSQDGINIFSFSLNPLEYQPSSNINMSQIDDAYIQLTLHKLINYNNGISISGYGLGYNLLRISDGLCGLGYYL
jgi:hypothetical protein